ncbi:MAG: hypothetical protein ABII89_02345 [Candidatus Omnitrophota bacterium]
MPWKDDEIKRLLRKSDIRSYNGRFERLKLLLSVEDQGAFPLPTLTNEYYEEARLCWYAGAFVATIIMVQLSFEEFLRSHYRMAKGVGGTLNNGKKVDQAGFFDLIAEAQNDNYISKKEAELLHDLRKNIRNPYVHTKDVKIDDNGKEDSKSANFFTQFFKITTPERVGCDVRNEAEKAIRLLVISLPQITRRSGGL